MSELPLIGSVWRHKKGGGTYVVLSHCMIEATLTPGIIYSGGHGFALDGRIWSTWCRPASEFMDGRFESLNIKPTPPNSHPLGAVAPDGD